MRPDKPRRNRVGWLRIACEGLFRRWRVLKTDCKWPARRGEAEARGSFVIRGTKFCPLTAYAENDILFTVFRTVAQPGSAFAWGAKGLGFKSRRSDHFQPPCTAVFLSAENRTPSCPPFPGQIVAARKDALQDDERQHEGSVPGRTFEKRPLPHRERDVRQHGHDIREHEQAVGGQRG